jgi:class 3 adenylate cyclase
MRCQSCGNENPVGAKFCNECAAPLTAGIESARAPTSVAAGRYLLRELLGEGARKRVYAGTDTRLGREVAVAVIKTEDLDSAGRQRLDREVRAMARLGDHPNVVTVFDVGEEDGCPYIVSQLMAGGSLAELLDKAPEHRLSVGETLKLGCELSLALEHVHSHGVVHRDIKPANVWRAADGTVLLGDFGLAAVTDHSRLTTEGMVVGTVAYLAPEQAVGRPPEPRSDLYSLGTVLYESLSGRPPFVGEDAVAVISQHLNTAPVAPSWHNGAVTPALDELVLALLAKDPDDRPASAAVVLEALRGIATAPTEETPVPGARTRLPSVGRMVGRETELAALTSAYDQATSGQARVVMVVGEPGIGKTRLLEEAATYASLRGAAVCWGHCYEGELGVAYAPFVEAFRTYVRARSDEELRSELSVGAPEVATLVSELRLRFGDLPPSPPLEGDGERMRLFEGVTTFLHNATAAQPMVLLLEDLHWSDKASLLLLQYLARNLRRDRLLIVATYRDVELDRTHPLADAISALRHERLYERVLLRGLSAEEVKALIDAIDDQDSPLAFARTIHQETEGNPFFVAEILRHLAEIGAISKVGGTWVGDAEAIAENLPEGVREVIGRRLSRLSDEANDMLSVAAAMPGGFVPEIVATVLGTNEDDMLDLLDEALAAQVLKERREQRGTYEFSHALIRQTLYGEASTPRRVRLHRQIALALEATPGSADIGELAFHWFQGAPGGKTEIDKAVDYATQAAERASDQAAHEEGARFYDMALQALDLAEDVDEERRAELLLGFGTACQTGGDAERAQVALAAAAQLARNVGNPRLLARVALAAASYQYGGVHQPELNALLEEAAAGLGEGDEALRARVLATGAVQYAFVDHDRLVALSAEALALARHSEDPSASADVLTILTRFLPMGAEEIAQALEVASLSEEARDYTHAIQAWVTVFTGGFLAGDREAIDTAANNTSRLASMTRSPVYMGQAVMHRCVIGALEGRFAEADELAAELLILGRRIRDLGMVAGVGAVILPVRREQGRLGELESATRRAGGLPGVGIHYRACLAQMLCELGRHTEAADCFEHLATDGFAAIPNDLLRTWSLCALAEVTVALDDKERAAVLLDLLRPMAGRAAMMSGVSYYGAVDRYLGILEICLGRCDEAVADLEEALAYNERMRARPWSTRTRYDLARALLGRNGPRDRSQAVALLNESLEAANDIGMSRLIEEALAVKLELQGASSSSPAASIDVVAARISLERPDLTPHVDTQGQITIVFSDIEGYSAMNERLGDHKTQELLREHHTIVREAVKEHRGVEVKSEGDGFMLAFPNPADAVNCCTAIQRALASHDFAGERMRVRMGIHSGEVIAEADDFYGRTVILAARVANSARGGEVLATSEVKEAVADAHFDEGREVSLKGFATPQRIFTVLVA